MTSSVANLRSKVNMLVQKKQISEPTVKYVCIDNTRWHCSVEIDISGNYVRADAEAPTKGDAYEQALSSLKLPDIRPAKSAVPKGCWMFTVDEDSIDVTFTAPSGEIKTETIKNTSNIIIAMQKIARCD